MGSGGTLSTGGSPTTRRPTWTCCGLPLLRNSTDCGRRRNCCGPLSGTPSSSTMCKPAVGACPLLTCLAFVTKGSRLRTAGDQQADASDRYSALAYAVSAEAGGDSRVQCSSHRSGSHSDNSSVVGFSPRANNPGNASRRNMNGSMPKCLHVPTTLYNTAAVCPPVSLPSTPQFFLPTAMARNVRSLRLLSIAKYPCSRLRHSACQLFSV